MALDRRLLTSKHWKRQWRDLRRRIVSRLLDTRRGRRWLIESIGPRVLSMTVDCGDHVMTFSPADYIGRKIFRKGQFERDHVDRLLAVLRQEGLLRKKSVLLELGGNIGTQTVYFALSGAYRQIVSVEPDPRNFRLLRANIDENRLGDKVTLINCAAGEFDGEIDFFLNRDNHGKSSAIRQSEKDQKVKVPVRPVRKILKDANIDREDVGLIWMDIEGYEPVACRSMEDLMRRKVPLYMEFTPLFYGAQQTADFIRYLAGFYTECLVFSESETRALPVTDIPAGEAQFDVLLLR